VDGQASFCGGERVLPTVAGVGDELVEVERDAGPVGVAGEGEQVLHLRW
jgi:hypothetical protein